MPTDPLAEFLVSHAQAIVRLHRRGNADAFGLTPADLGTALHRSVSAWGAAKPAAIDGYLDKLRANDFVLALACTNCNERAWKAFTETHRPLLYTAAHALIRDEAGARDLADSLWADLQGMDMRADHRRSLLGYYGGRSSLETWLHAALARRFVDLTRATARTRPLESRADEPADGDPPDADRSRHASTLGTALSEALGALEPRDRLRLGYYYLESLTLREIARLMSEHPSSVSRRLQQTRGEIKRWIENAGGAAKDIWKDI